MLCTFCFSKGKLDVMSSMKQVYKSSGPVCVLLRSLLTFTDEDFSTFTIRPSLCQNLAVHCPNKSEPPREDGNALRGKFAVFSDFFLLLSLSSLMAVNLLPNPSTRTTFNSSQLSLSSSHQQITGRSQINCRRKFTWFNAFSVCQLFFQFFSPFFYCCCCCELQVQRTQAPKGGMKHWQFIKFKFIVVVKIWFSLICFNVTGGVKTRKSLKSRWMSRWN